MKVFLDTNVVVDFCMRREPFFHDAAVIFDLAYQRRISVVISSLTFVNLVYLGRKVMDSDALLRKVQWLMNLSEVSKIDRTVISQAVYAKRKDFEDAVQFYSAATLNVDLIVTRDKKGFGDLNMVVQTPAEFIRECIG